MRRTVLVSAIVSQLLCCFTLAASAYTLSFDDISAGGGLASYGEQYGAFFGSDWEVADGIQSGWGQPHSGANVAVWNGPPDHGATAWFGYKVRGEAFEVGVQSLGAYVSTRVGATLRMVGYATSPWREVAAVSVGDSNQSWSDRYVEMSSKAAGIEWLVFEPVGPLDARNQFCMDDLTVTPVPEPSSLVALCVGAGALVAVARRRRRQ